MYPKPLSSQLEQLERFENSQLRIRLLSSFSLVLFCDIMKTPKSAQTSLESKLEGICSCIEGFEFNPKSFIAAFLDSQGYNMSFRQRFWGTDYGWSSTKQLLASLQQVICAHMKGKAHWENFILTQVDTLWPFNCVVPSCS
jgi:hypothetical protein